MEPRGATVERRVAVLLQSFVALEYFNILNILNIF